MTERTNRTDRSYVFLLVLAVFFFALLFFADKSAQAVSCGMGQAGTCTPSVQGCGTGTQISAGSFSCLSDEICCQAAATFPQSNTNAACLADGAVCAGNNCCNGPCIADSSGTFRCGGGASVTSNSNQSSGTPDPAISGTSGSGWSLGSIAGFGLPQGTIFGIISGILTWLLGALGIIGVIGFVISGIMYLVSTGDETMIERAKGAMRYSIIGIIVGLIGVVVIQAIDLALRGFGMF